MGLTTAEIANAFLVPETGMAQRISRAKQRIKASGEPFRMPTRNEQTARLRLVLHVLYLIFNEGYAVSTGRELHRTELSDEAIRVAKGAVGDYQLQAALTHYLAAASRTTSLPELRYLATQAARLKTRHDESDDGPTH